MTAQQSCGLVLLVAVAGFCPGCSAPAPANTPSTPPATTQSAPAPAAATSASTSEKDARTPAQQKINSQLLYEIYRADGTAAAKGVPPGPTGVEVDAAKRALIDVRADVTRSLEQVVKDAGGAIVSTSVEAHSIVAWVPLLKLEQLAGDARVRAIEPRARGAGR